MSTNSREAQSAQAGNLLLQPARLGLGDIALFPVSLVQRSQVTGDAGVDLLHPPDDLGDGVVLVAIVHRFELAAVDRNNGTGEEFEPTAKLDKLTTHRLDRRAIILAEVGNRLESAASRDGRPAGPSPPVSPPKIPRRPGSVRR